MKLENATGRGWSFRQVGHFDGTRGRENGRHVCWIIHGRGNMPVTSPSPICIGEYLASEIYPNHDLEFRRPAIDQPIRRIDIPRWQMWRRSRIQRNSVFIETCYYCFHDQCNDSFPGERRFVRFVKKKKFGLFEEISRWKTLFLLRLNRVFERRMAGFSRRI